MSWCQGTVERDLLCPCCNLVCVSDEHWLDDDKFLRKLRWDIHHLIIFDALASGVENGHGPSSSWKFSSYRTTLDNLVPCDLLLPLLIISWCLPMQRQEQFGRRREQRSQTKNDAVDARERPLLFCAMKNWFFHPHACNTRELKLSVEDAKKGVAPFPSFLTSCVDCSERSKDEKGGLKRVYGHMSSFSFFHLPSTQQWCALTEERSDPQIGWQLSWVVGEQPGTSLVVPWKHFSWLILLATFQVAYVLVEI